MCIRDSIWTALAVLVAVAATLATAVSLVQLVVVIDGVLFLALFALAASQPTLRPATPTPTDQSR